MRFTLARPSASSRLAGGGTDGGFEGEAAVKGAALRAYE